MQPLCSAVMQLNPCFAVYEQEDGGGVWNLPKVNKDRQEQAVKLVGRVGGPNAATQI
jgi:hypothetical protein